MKFLLVAAAEPEVVVAVVAAAEPEVAAAEPEVVAVVVAGRWYDLRIRSASSKL